MSLPLHKKVPKEEWEEGKEYFAMGNQSLTKMFHFVYLGNNKIKNLYTLKEEEVGDNIEWFERYWYRTEREAVLKKLYQENKNKHSLNIIGVFNNLKACDGSHEPYNAWISYDAYEMLDNLLEESFFIIGCAPAPYGESWLGHKNIALVIEEYDSGNHYWCHCPEDFIEDVREELAEEYKEIERMANEDR